MTGYGRASGEVAGRSVVVEVRSVNARFLDVRVRTDWSSLGLEVKLEELVRRELERGHVEIHVAPEGSGAAEINVLAASELYQTFEKLRQTLGLPDPVTLGLLASHPALFSKGAENADRVWSQLEPLAKTVLDSLNQSRAREGKRLGQDLVSRTDRLRHLVQDMAQAAEGSAADCRRELLARLAKLELPVGTDPTRLAQEVALLAQRADTTEERVRLLSHLDEITGLLNQGDTVGRRLDFLLQEVQRELSTLAAKSQSAALARLVVDARAESEKMREQARNLE